MPKAAPTLSSFNTLKRKQYEPCIPFIRPTLTLTGRSNDLAHSATNKKTKKAAVSKHTAPHSNSEYVDHAALSRRAARFQREHEIERQKTLQASSSSLTFLPPSQFQSRSVTPGLYGDEPEANPVCAFPPAL